MENNSHSRAQELKDNVGSGLTPVRKKFSKYFQELSRLESVKSENTIQVKIIKELNSYFEGIVPTIQFPLRFLTLPAFKHYQSCHIFLQEKGKTTADHYFSQDSKVESKFELQAQHFNKMFSMIKKSKNKIFHQNLVPQIDLKLVGSFLANAFNLRDHNLIIIISRHDFLQPTAHEIKLFDDYSLELPHFFEKNLIVTGVKTRRLYYTEALKLFPQPLQIIDEKGSVIFQNFLTPISGLVKEKIELPQNHQLLLYQGEDTDTSSELFHHQRVSLLGELLNTLRHELNNPLFGMKLTSDLLIHEAFDEEQASILKEISINVTRSQNIMENFSNLYTNTDVYQVCSLKKIIDEALTLAKSEIRQVRVNQYFEGEMRPEFNIFTNPTSLVQIFFNLIINSSQAMRQAQTKSASIIFNFKKLNNQMIIEMMDNGPGIPEAIEDKLFEPFFTTKVHGTGLGLAITMNLVKHLKGKIHYQKSSLGGAQFNISFPFENMCLPEMIK
ncbi:MAG: ATP-binding protein [Bacteriovoracaceae bacterium]